jgi:DNA-binding response OmpR family regulator
MVGQAASRRILVVEDDDSISMGLEMNLSAEGYDVSLAANGEDGLALARSEPFDLIILDVMLPKLNGFEVLRHLRQSGHFTPVMMLSARGAEMDKVMGLELGAEDYVTKPFGLAELLARIKAMLRRESRLRTPADEVRFSDVLIRRSTREVLRDGALVELTATEFDVLLCLVDAQGNVLSREQIQTAVWGANHHGTLRTIDNFLLQLRQKLEKEPQRPQHLVTVRGVGYRFAPLWILTCSARTSPPSTRSPPLPACSGSLSTASRPPSPPRSPRS